MKLKRKMKKMGNEMITVNCLSRMFRTIPRSEQHRDTCKNGFMECLKSVESENKSCEVKRGTDAGMYRQTISEKIQNMPYHPSNDLDTTMISISDAGIERMMKDPGYESWVMKQIKGVFAWNDPFRGLAGGKLNIIRVGAAEEDLKITTERAGFPNGQDSMMPKVYDDDDGFWIRREKRFDDQMDMVKEIQMRESNGIVTMPSPILTITGKTGSPK